MENLELKKQEKKSYQWYNWNSPVGISIFIVSLCLAILIISFSLDIVVKAGEKGVKIEQKYNNDESSNN